MRPSGKTVALSAAAELALFPTAFDNSHSPSTAAKSERYVAIMGVGGSSFHSFTVAHP